MSGQELDIKIRPGCQDVSTEVPSHGVLPGSLPVSGQELDIKIRPGCQEISTEVPHHGMVPGRHLSAAS